MSELFREIQEDIRRERIDQFWARFGKWMIWMSMVAIVATVGHVAWTHYSETRAREHTALFLKAEDQMAAKNYTDAMATFAAISNDPHSDYYALAELNKAKAQVLLGDEAAARTTYQSLAKQQEGIFGDMARLLALGSNEVLFEPKKNSAFFWSEQEWQAWQLIAEGKKGEASVQLITLRGNLEAPFSMRERAAEIISHITPGRLPKTTEEPAHE